MKCWNQLNLKFDNVLKLDKDKLAKDIVDDQCYQIGQPHLLFFLHTASIFQEDFLEVLKLKNLILLPFSVGFLVHKKTQGFVHRDYYRGVPVDLANEGVPHAKEINDFTFQTKFNNEDKYYHCALHLNLGNSGRLEWYDGECEETFFKTELKVPVYKCTEEQNLKVIDFLQNSAISICRSDILHRSCNDDDDNYRVVITARFVGNPTFEQIKTQLNELIIERE